MRRAWKIFRAIVSVLLLAAVVLPMACYILITLEPIQDKLRNIAQTELSKALGADVGIERIGIRPFNRLKVRGLSLCLDNDTIARAATVQAGVEIFKLISTGELAIDYALIDGVEAHIWRHSVGTPLNIQPVIDHLRSDKPRNDRAIELKINTVILRKASFTYDVLTAPAPDSLRFDARHVAVSNLALNAFIPAISATRYCVNIDHLSFNEQCGFELKSLCAKIDIDSTSAGISDLVIDLPGSHLAFEPIALNYNGINNIVHALDANPVAIALTGSVATADFAPFAPMLRQKPLSVNLTLMAEASLKEAHLKTLVVEDVNDAYSLEVQGSAYNFTNPDSLSFTIDNAAARAYVTPWGSVTLTTTAAGTLSNATAHAIVLSDAGNVDIDGSYRRMASGNAFNGNMAVSGLDLGKITGNKILGPLTATVAGKAIIGRGAAADIAADISAEISALSINGRTLHNITAKGNMPNRNSAELNIVANDWPGTLLAYAVYNKQGNSHRLNATASASDIDFYGLGLDNKHPGYRFGARATIDLAGTTLNNLTGNIQMADVRLLDAHRQGIRVPRFNLALNPSPQAVPNICIDSSVLTGSLTGHYNIKDLNDNRFRFDITLLPALHDITQFFGLPLHVLHNVDIEGNLDAAARFATIDIDAPYLRQGDKLIENTYLHAKINGDSISHIYATTQFPTKKGDMSLAATLNGTKEHIDTHIDWTMERAKPIGGSIDFATDLRGVPGKNAGPFGIDASIAFNPGTITFGEDLWTIKPSTIDITPTAIKVAGFGLDAPSQHIAINGIVGTAETDSVVVSLDNVAVLPIFDTLEINAVMIGGRATGDVSGSRLFSNEPHLRCPGLHVDSISYLGTPIGNADIVARWRNDIRSINLDADISGFEGRQSRIYGDILPIDNALDINFDVDSVPVTFMQPLLKAITSKVGGRGTGKFRLFGTFKEVDMEGDVFANNFSMKVDFTGVTYYATDSVHLRPGKIILDNITVRDAEGHTACLNGLLTHEYFKDPMIYRFDVTKADNILGLNTTARDNPNWYGRLYGRGKASIYGRPGVVNIDVDMVTGPGSSFSYVLNDRLDAAEYSFLTFRDLTPDSMRIAAVVIEDIPDAVRAFKRKQDQVAATSSKFNMDMRLGINKDAAMTLVMDPATADEIHAHGDGNVHLAYHSANDDLNIWGKYVLSDGSYRFTLQDIIIKDFTIADGSAIQFDGDPNAVKTKIKAYYSLNANLTDLDESFAQDKDIARTSVPVHAILNVNGDIRQPAIDFDLEFPTLTSDTYRKVRSIVSTDDMMNRQIIYLLALNRFYTPDYMASTTKGNELFSVASSTITSQFSSMLGKLSDKWSIAPNLRSDRGDFSDLEVDVALSSRLLNNRLLLNGNFGYRDKSLNTNQFIGDFDIEYLLNRKGSWRLKAYNRYNDRNYYVRSALTTQGVGIMFRLDFDRLFKAKTKAGNESDNEIEE